VGLAAKMPLDIHKLKCTCTTWIHFRYRIIGRCICTSMDLHNYSITDGKEHLSCKIWNPWVTDPCGHFYMCHAKKQYYCTSNTTLRQVYEARVTGSWSKVSKPQLLLQICILVEEVNTVGRLQFCKVAYDCLVESKRIGTAMWNEVSCFKLF